MSTGFCMYIYVHFFWVNGIAGMYGKCVFKLVRNCQTVFLSSCAIFHCHPKFMKLLLLHMLQYLILLLVFFFSILRGKVIPHWCFGWIFLMTDDVEHLLTYLFAIHIKSLMKHFFKSFACFQIFRGLFSY